jgi:membrane-associated phospholipid phosphatase
MGRRSAGSSNHGGKAAGLRAAICCSALLAIATATVIVLLAFWTSGHRGPVAIDAVFDVGVTDEHGNLRFLAHALAVPGGRRASLALALGAGGLLSLRRRDWAPLLLLLAGYVGASSTCFIAKRVVDRVPPRLVSDAAQSAGLAFPSAHVTRLAAIVGMVVLIVAVQRGGRAGLAVAATGVFLVAFTGAALVYLRLHWFTDLLGGLAVGCLWTALLAPAAFHLVGQEVRRAGVVAEVPSWSRDRKVVRI